MAVRDLELRRGVEEWRRLLVPVAASLGAAALAGAAAWGGATHDQQTLAQDLDRQRSRADVLDARLQKVEQQAPAVARGLNDLNGRVESIDHKIDVLLARPAH